MIGAILGDIIGSVFEGKNVKTTDIQLKNFGARITDDSVLSIAIADALLTDRNYEQKLISWARKYPWAGYGGNFHRWMTAKEQQPYNSWGNGSAMRVSAVAYAFNDLASVLEETRKTALPTHNHPEGIKGAEAIAAATFLARKGESKFQIKTFIEEEFGYDLDRTIEEIRPDYKFDVSCQGSVPEAIIAFLDSMDYESCIRLAISLGGDSDTIACMAGGIAEAHYGIIPDELLEFANKRIPKEMKELLMDFAVKHSFSHQVPEYWF